jgi:hypothetical protein
MLFVIHKYRNISDNIAGNIIANEAKLGFVSCSGAASCMPGCSCYIYIAHICGLNSIVIIISGEILFPCADDFNKWNTK